MGNAAAEYDVVIIGGGPGGAMASTLLADFGKKVLLLEATAFPRYHIGESLLSGTAELLNKIGVLSRLESEGYIKKFGVEWVWGSERQPWKVYFKDALAMPYDWGYQVERGPFDDMLLKNAREHGVEVREQHLVSGFEIGADAISRTAFRDAGGAHHSVTSRWIIDASGQGGLVTKRLHHQAWDPFLKNTAIWSYWRGARRGDGIDAGNTFLPTFTDGWWWFIPLRHDITSIGVVVDRGAFLARKDDGPEAYYLDCLSHTPEMGDRLTGAERIEKIRVQRDWSYIYDRFSGDGYLAVGDAACFIDPLFSTGVHLAMLSGMLGAVSVNTVLDMPDIDRAKVLDFYETTYRKEFARLRAQVYFLYSGHGTTKESYFWQARSQFDVPEITPERAFISLIAGAFQHRSWYSRFLTQLDVPTLLRSTIEDIFDGKSMGVGIDLHTPLARSQDCPVVDDLAINGPYLTAAASVRLPGGGTVPLTASLSSLLDFAIAGRNALDLVDLLVSHGHQTREGAYQLVHEAASLGLLTPSAHDQSQR
jgi:flavin-dependent dehydrogenase